MRGNLSKRGLNGSKGETGDKGDTPSIEFEYNAATGELKYRSDGILVNKNYISSHDIVTKDQVNKLKQFVITLDDKFAGDKTYDEIVGAFKEGREIVGLLPPRVPGAYEMLRFTVSGYTENTVTLSTFMPYKQLLITCNKNNIWSAELVQIVTEEVFDNRVSQKLEGTEKTINKVTDIDKTNATDDKYPSEYAVVQYVATETSTVKGKMQGLVNEYKQECDEKINKQNETITGVQNRLDNQSIEMAKTTLQLNSNKNNITALQGRVKENKEDCDLKFEDSTTRIESLYSMLSVQESKNNEQDARLDSHDDAIGDIESLRNDLFAESERNNSQETMIEELIKAVNNLKPGTGDPGGSGGAALPSLIVNTNVSFQDFANDIKEPGIYQLTRKETTGNRFTSCAYLVVTKNGKYKDGCSQFLISSDEFGAVSSLMFRQFTYRFDFETNVEEEAFTEWISVVGQNAINKILNGEDAVGLANRAFSDNDGNAIHETYATKDEVGNLERLTTMNKSSIVDAINGLDSDCDGRHQEHMDDIMMLLKEIETIKTSLSELSEASSEHDLRLDGHDSVISNDIPSEYATKAELRPTPITTIPSTLNANTPYNLGELTELSLLFPTTATDGDVIYVNFESGATATNLTVDTSNTTDIDLIPEVNTGYEVYAKYNGSIWIVKYSEYTVSEVA